MAVVQMSGGEWRKSCYRNISTTSLLRKPKLPSAPALWVPRGVELYTAHCYRTLGPCKFLPMWGWLLCVCVRYDAGSEGVGTL